MTPQILSRVAGALLRQLQDERQSRAGQPVSRTAAAAVQSLEPRVLLSGSVLEDAAPVETVADPQAGVVISTTPEFRTSAAVDPSLAALGTPPATDPVALFPVDQTFNLSSRPGASKTIYLDFNGHTVSGTAWNSYNGGADFTLAGYSFEGDASFSNAELIRIQRIWARVAEDFAPFDVNVTTVEPPVSDLINSGGGDTRWGVRALIGGTFAPFADYGGVAFLTSFNWDTDTPALVFEDNLGDGDEKFTAEATSHEVGHSLNLNHDGRTTPPEEYYGGHGSGATGWAPIMGVGYDQNLAQWSKGEYSNASQTEDDLNIITTQNGFGYRADDYGSNALAASNLGGSAGSGAFTVNQSGVIEQSTDTDWFTFTTTGGVVSLNVGGALVDSNLDIEATLLNSSFGTVQTSNPVDGLTASLTATLAAGTYYLKIDGVGKGNPLADGYTDYGSLGQYTVTGSIPTAAGLPVVVFDNGLYVDTSNSASAESDTLQATLTAQGASVSTFTGLTANDWTTVLAGKAVLVIPELENGDLVSALDEDARDVIRRFVASGGGLIVGGESGTNDTNLLNTLFGYNLTSYEAFTTTNLQTAAADGTAFEGGAAALPWNDGSYYLATSSLPDSAKSIYNDTEGGTSVALFQEGAGKVIFLGWDWFNAAPVGTQDGGWLNVLDRAVDEVNTHTSFLADFTDGNGNASLDGFTIDNSSPDVPGLWHLSRGRRFTEGHSPQDSLYFGRNEGINGGGNYDVGRTAGRITSPVLDVVAGSTLSFSYFLDVENGALAYDLPRLLISVEGGAFTAIDVPFNRDTTKFEELSVDLSSYAGQKVQVRFDFDTGDDVANGYEGWYIDDVKLTVRSQPGKLAEPNDSIFQASQLGLDGYGHTRVDGFIGNGLHGDDADFYHFKALAGSTVTIGTEALGYNGSLIDTMLRLYDANGNVIYSDDDSGPGLNSLIQYNVTTSGDYYVAVVGYPGYPTNPLEPGTTPVGNSFGRYILDVNVDITSLAIYGTDAADNVAFTTEGDGSLSATINGIYGNYGVGNVVNVQVFGRGGDDTLTAYGVAGLSYFEMSGEGGNDTLSALGATTAVTFFGGENDDSLTGSEANDFLEGGNGNDTYYFQDSAGPQGDVISEGADGGNDTLDFSASTQDAYVNLNSATTLLGTHGSRTLSTAVAGGGLYLQNLTGGSGNDAFIGNATANRLTGNGGNDTFRGREGSDILDGGSGNDNYLFEAGAQGNDQLFETSGIDLISFADKTVGITFNLWTTGVQTIEAGHTVKLNSNSQFENLNGGSGNDFLYGNALNNVIAGINGNDLLRAYAGDDTLNGGQGNDTYVFDAGAQGYDQLFDAGTGIDTIDLTRKTTDITFNLWTSSLQTVETGHTVKLNSNALYENVSGGSGNDKLFGNALNNVLVGGLGHDQLRAYAGDDTLNGGEGDDTYIFDAGAQGNDLLIDAGTGVDHLDFSRKTVDITVNLFTSGVQTIEAGHTVRLNSNALYEDATGGTGNDKLFGNALNNVLVGGLGNDQLRAYGGNNSLNGGEGNDAYVFDAATTASDLLFEAGTGIDQLDFSRKTSNLTFSLWTSGVQTVEAGHTIKLNSNAQFENIVGGSGNDTFTGNALNNLLFGGAGNDVLNGVDGLDVLIGGTGSDTVSGGNGDDLVIANNYTNAGNPAALAAIQAEWTNIANSYATRVGRLRGTIPGAAFTLTAVTVPNDGVTDTITGGNNDDWFWGLASEFTDKQVAESAN